MVAFSPSISSRSMEARFEPYSINLGDQCPLLISNLGFPPRAMISFPKISRCSSSTIAIAFKQWDTSSNFSDIARL